MTNPMIKATAIKPSLIDVKSCHDIMLEEANAIADAIIFDFSVATSTWTKQPVFVKIVSFNGNMLEILVGTDNEIFRYVDEGTRPHVILPKNASVLAFKSQFVPKTTPGKLVPGAGSSGGKTVFSKGVIHPGIEPRKISETIAKEWNNKRIRNRIQQAIDKCISASGHAM